MTEYYHIEQHVWAWAIAGLFSFSATIIALIHMRLHYKFNQNHLLLKYVMRILGMVPLYAIEAWLGLYAKNYTMYWDVLRECYEALVIYSFYQFLVTYLGGKEKLVSTLRESETRMHHLFPFRCCFKEWELGEEFVYLTKIGILQYVPVKLFTAITTFILEASDVYNSGQFDPQSGYPYMAFLNNMSQIWAMYCLVLFYYSTKENLKPIHPMPKFICIKAVVFFTFWQSVIVSFFVEIGKIHATETYTTENVSSGFQDFLICVEMFFAAFSHIYAFPHKEFYESNAQMEIRPTMERLTSFLHPRDLYEDVKDIFKGAPKKKAGALDVVEETGVHTENENVPDQNENGREMEISLPLGQKSDE